MDNEAIRHLTAQSLHGSPPASSERRLRADLISTRSALSSAHLFLHHLCLPSPSVMSSRQLQILTGTWNVNGKPPDSRADLSHWLLPSPEPCDLYMLGFQEVQALAGVDAVRTDANRGFAWRYAVDKVLAPLGLILVAERQLVGILIVVFIRKEHQPYLSEIKLSYAGTGFLNVGGNKGAVAARFRLYDRSLSCVSCHLAAHDGNVDRRNSDFRDIVNKAMFVSDEKLARDAAGAALSGTALVAKKKPSGGRGRGSGLTSSGGATAVAAAAAAASAAGSAQQWFGSFAAAAAVALADANAGGDSGIMNDPNALNILDHDAVFWLGDLNYRIDARPEQVLDWIEKEDWASLSRADQLGCQFDRVGSFDGFFEARIRFAPTYKMNRFEDVYSRDEVSGELKRTPAYTDRILWRCGLPECAPALRPDLHLEKYTSATVYSSDHRPVLAVFSMVFVVHEDDNIADSAAALSRAAVSTAKAGARRDRRDGLVKLSEDRLSLGTVRYERRRSTQLVITNKSDFHVTLSFQPSEFPPWLSLRDEKQRTISSLKPGEFETVVFDVLVTLATACASKLTSGEMALETQVKVMVNRGLDKSVGFTIQGNYASTCLGCSLEQLASHTEAISSSAGRQKAACRRARGGSIGSVDLNTRDKDAVGSLLMSLPKEIWWLGDLLWRTRDQEEDAGSDSRRWIDQERYRRIFLASGDLEYVEVVQDHIDRGHAMPADVDALAVASCLLNLLRSLDEPVIPTSAYSEAMDVARKGDPVGLTYLLTLIPSINGNVFRYIISILLEMPSVKDGSGVDDLSDVFGEALLAQNRDRPGRDMRDRAMFVRLALLNPKAAHHEAYVPHMAVFDIAKTAAPPAAHMLSTGQARKQSVD